MLENLLKKTRPITPSSRGLKLLEKPFFGERSF